MAIVLVVLGGVVGRGEIRFNQLATGMKRVELLERAQLATTDPAAIMTTLRTARDEPVLTVVTRTAGGDSYAINSRLPALPVGQTYELWRSGEEGEVAAVALGRRPDAVMFSLPSGVTGFVLTVESASVPSRPSLPAVAGAHLSP